MNATLAIARREIRERANLFIAAAALAVVPLLAALLPIAKTVGHSSVIALLGGFIAMGTAFGVATLLGASIIGRDLNDNRLSFYFSKPVSASALWFGKVAASVLTIATTFLIVVVPTFVFGRGMWRQTWVDSGALIGGTLVIAIALFFVSHIATTMTRSRSVLLALDLALMVASIAAAVLILRPLMQAFALGLTGTMMLIMAAAVLVILAIAPVYQLAQGRTDARRSHAALARVLWPSIAAVLLIAAAYVAWVVSVPPSAIVRDLQAQPAPSGDWQFVEGRATGRMDYVASFVMNGADGRFVRTSGPLYWGATFSRDGRTAAFFRPTDMYDWSHSDAELYVANLDGDAQPRPTGIFASGGEFALSEDGSRVVVRKDEYLVVYDVAAKRSIATVRHDARDSMRMAFVTPELVRVVRQSRDHGSIAVRFFDFDVARKTLTNIANVPMPGNGAYVMFSADGSRLLVGPTGGRGPEALLVDAHSGAVTMRIPNSPRATMLQDGTVTAVIRTPAGLRLQSFGAKPVDLALPAQYEGAIVSRSLGGGRVLVSARRNGTAHDVLVVDLNRGAIERVEQGLRCTDLPWASLMPSLPSTRLSAYDAKGNLVSWDVATGAKKVLVAL